jgi:RNA polymerase sigma-70 factor (ECF subfamily)
MTRTAPTRTMPIRPAQTMDLGRLASSATRSRLTGEILRSRCTGPVAMTDRRDEEFDAYLAAAIRGDRVAVDFILRTIRPLVVRYCRARLGRTERTFASADDVAQEVCMAILTALSSYREQGRNFDAFVYGIAAHKVIDAYRAAGRNKSEPVPDLPDIPEVSDGPEHRALQLESAEEMRRTLEVLPEKQREILVLRVVNGLSAEETAEAVGLTPVAVRVAQHRALGRLRRSMSAR